VVTIEQAIPWGDLEDKVRQTTLLSPNKEQATYPYEHARITLDHIKYEEVAPTSLYVLRKNLAVQAMIATDIAAEGYHPLELEGGLVLQNEAGERSGFVPPIVEETDAEGKYVLDGAHRTSIGRWMGRTGFLAIHVTGIRPDCPGYAYPNDWDAVRIFEEVPSNPAEKKHYRGEAYRDLYRDFSELNGSRLREA
jgi:hypothetical protein